MTIYAKTIIQASKTVLANKNYRAAFFMLVPLLFFLLVLIPIEAIPGNDFKTQFSLYKPHDYIMLISVSGLVSLFFLMHAYNFKRMREARAKAGLIGNSGIGGSAGALASVFGAATCPMCVASLFGFLGVGAVGFLLQYQWWVFAATFLLMLLSLYFASQKVNGICDKCL